MTWAQLSQRHSKAIQTTLEGDMQVSEAGFALEASRYALSDLFSTLSHSNVETIYVIITTSGVQKYEMLTLDLTPCGYP